MIGPSELRSETAQVGPTSRAAAKTKKATVSPRPTSAARRIPPRVSRCPSPRRSVRPHFGSDVRLARTINRIVQTVAKLPIRDRAPAEFLDRNREQHRDHSEEDQADQGKGDPRAGERRASITPAPRGAQAEEGDPRPHGDHAANIRWGELLTEEEGGNKGGERPVCGDCRGDHAERSEPEGGEDGDI